MWSRLTNGHLNLLFFLLYQYKLNENTQDDSLLIRRVPSTPHGGKRKQHCSNHNAGRSVAVITSATVKMLFSKVRPFTESLPFSPLTF